MEPDNLSEAILVAVGSATPIDFSGFCTNLRVFDYLPADKDRAGWSKVMQELRGLEIQRWLIVARERVKGRDMIQSLQLTEGGVTLIRAKLDNDRGLLNLQEVTADQAAAFMARPQRPPPPRVHACGDPDCIVPHPAPHKRPPSGPKEWD